MKTATTSSMQVSDEFTSTDGKVKLEGAKAGTWKIIEIRGSKMYLHNSLSVEVAAALALWEEIRAASPDTIKVTRDAEGLIIGVAIRR